MYHPTRGGVRGGRDQFKWDDVKVDKHRENYLGHSVKAPVGRWQKGKDLYWYTRDKKSDTEDALKEEIRRVKEEEEQAMREALGLAPKRSNRTQGNRLDKHEYAELIKRGSTAEDLGAGHAEAAQVQGLGLYKAPRDEGGSSSLSLDPQMEPEQAEPLLAPKQEDDLEDNRKGKRPRERDEKRGEKERKRDRHGDGKERRRDKHERRHDLEDRSKRHRKDKQKRRHDSDSD
ncbi:uncharacterized LOC100283199 [Zea mays]|uniref:Multiple myeloma tumor-associated protein 2 n=2 Tax=Zea mays TaxID=4577 RepID=B6TFM2_MAIZE|nr:uncharacterized LOC100283199 [Zea mays]ACG35905.1 multiple myeloma tumor-associated protein 2 [Zea mays]ACN25321.1 unknown [Zea mays]ONM04032.1 hypothetical protein ZEAMMB73_Zm00001d031941 [Zea mays]|eukprot:NP_001149573.1 uncharacterized protein LOC100283199 [Zea mays]